MKQHKKHISELDELIKTLRDKVYGTTKDISKVDVSSGNSDKIARLVATLADFEKQKTDISTAYESELSAIPNTLEGNLIRLKLNGYKWKELADISGRYISADGVRRMCERFYW